MIEDSRNGLLAADAAGLRCVMTVNGYTEDEAMSESVLVVSSLGDPGGEVTKVLANRSAARPGAWITLADLAALPGRLGATRTGAGGPGRAVRFAILRRWSRRTHASTRGQSPMS